MDKIQAYLAEAEGLVITYASKIVLAVIVLIIGFWLIKRFINIIDRIMKRREIDASLQPFLKSIISIVFKVMLIISVISILGVETTSFIAVLGSIGLAIGLALQGSLSNFAGGVIILTVKPFRVGDYITALNAGGTVQEISILTTILKTADNQIIYMPNGNLAADVITNFSQEPTRRLVITFGIHYDDDTVRAKQIINDIIAADERVLKEPAPSVVVAQLADSAVNIEMRVFSAQADFWDLKFDLTERVKIAFDREGITMPYPQRDLHVYQSSKS